MAPPLRPERSGTCHSNRGPHTVPQRRQGFPAVRMTMQYGYTHGVCGIRDYCGSADVSKPSSRCQYAGASWLQGFGPTSMPRAGVARTDRVGIGASSGESTPAPDKRFPGFRTAKQIQWPINGFPIALFHPIADIGDRKNLTRVWATCKIDLPDLMSWSFCPADAGISQD